MGETRDLHTPPDLTAEPLPDRDVEEALALAAYLVGYVLDLVGRVQPDHAGVAALREALHALGAKPGFRCTGCDQIRPADDFCSIRAGSGGRQQPCAGCCDARVGQAGRCPSPSRGDRPLGD